MVANAGASSIDRLCNTIYFGSSFCRAPNFRVGEAAIEKAARVLRMRACPLPGVGICSTRGIVTIAFQRIESNPWRPPAHEGGRCVDPRALNPFLFAHIDRREVDGSIVIFSQFWSRRIAAA